jgi:hypothetical protein
MKECDHSFTTLTSRYYGSRYAFWLVMGMDLTRYDFTNNPALERFFEMPIHFVEQECVKCGHIERSAEPPKPEPYQPRPKRGSSGSGPYSSCGSDCGSDSGGGGGE